MRSALVGAIVFFGLAWAPAGQSAEFVTYPPASGSGGGRHVVLLSGDEEYRSEEALPMLGKILSRRHGFRVTVLFAVDPDGTINPNNNASLPGSDALDTADLIVMSLRWRKWPAAEMERFERAYLRGTPIVALRTSTHPFNGFPEGSSWRKWNDSNMGGFGEQVIGETWVSHWGRHKVEGTRGVIEPARRDHPILRGVTAIFGDSDVYEAYPSADADILMRGLVVQSLQPDAAPATHTKRRATDRQEQPVNDPAMPIVWTRQHRNESGRVNRIVATTMGAATDLENEGLRRLVVNAVFWGLNLEPPAAADVTYVDPYAPSFYGFNVFRKGLRPSDFALGRVVPGTPTPRPAPSDR